MPEYGPATYGDRIAGIYDTYLPPAIDIATAEAVDFLANLAGSGRALELSSSSPSTPRI
jgi:hypothetical protein